MKKIKSYIIIAFIIVCCTTIIIIKNNIGFKEEMYIVSDAEVKDYEDISDNNLGVEINNDKEILTDISESTYQEDKMITIYISGQVKNPGVVTLENNKRLIDAIEILGGTTEDADLNRINMALRIEDEGHYIIPKIGEEISDNMLNNQNNKLYNGKNEDTENKININSSSIKELEELPGIGEATANKIFKYREENGEFKSIEEIKNVNGIGDKKYEGIKDLISIN